MADIQVLRTTTVKGQQKLASMREASKSRPDLTLEQANQIMNVSGLAPEYEEYKPRIAQYIVEVYKTLPTAERLPIQALIESAKHPCSQELTGSGGADLQQRVKEMKADGQSQEIIDSLVMGRIYGMAMVLASGYQEQFREHWVLDANGNIIGLKPPHNVRQPKCAAYVKSHTEKWRPGFADVGYGRTRKHKKRSKKTLRRRKMRRNMH